MNHMRKWLLFYILTAFSVLAASHWLSKAVTVISEYSPMERSSCIVIDAGHGGVDGGAISCTGNPESTYNLEISLRLRDLFHLLGYDTRMIRTSDISIYTAGDSIAQKKVSDLKERVRIVNETEHALLISIHQNNFSDSRYSGAQVFYAGNEKSEKLAKELQTAFKTALNPSSTRLCKKSSGIYLMDHISKPGILVECGFLSNREEEAKLRSKQYQQQICCVIASCVSNHLSNT